MSEVRVQGIVEEDTALVECSKCGPMFLVSPRVATPGYITAHLISVHHVTDPQVRIHQP